MFKWFYKVEEWLGYCKRVMYSYDNRQFACYVGCGCFSGMAEVIIYESRPNKKLFKEKYVASKSFWLDDFKTIDEGVFDCLIAVIIEEKEQNRIQEKWQEFEKTLDK